MPAEYRYGTHTESILNDAAARGSVIFSQAPAAATQVAQPQVQTPEYRFGSHSEAILQQAAAQASVVFSPVLALGFPASPRPTFTIAEPEQLLQLIPPCSWVQRMPAALFPVTTPQAPPLGLILANPTPFAPEWMTPQSTVFTPTAARLPNILPTPPLRVQATAIGVYNGILRGVGDVFDVLAAQFSDSTIDYSNGATGGPVFGWMQTVPPTTPLTIPGEQIYDYTSGRRLVF